LRYLQENFLGSIYFVLGNADSFEKQDILMGDNFNYYGKVGLVEIAGINIGLCHEPYLVDKVLELGECDFVFYGHTHKPWIEERDGVNVVNPGTLGGMFQKSTFAVLDTKTNNLELKLTNSL
jgi:putative phosphoesterase